MSKLTVTGPLVLGGPLRVSVTVRNAGRVRAKASRTSFVLSRDARRGRGDPALSRARTKALKARKVTKRTIQLTAPALLPAGTWRVIACADARRKVKESKERNNCRASRALSVVPPTVGPPGPGPGPTQPPVATPPEATPVPTASPTATPTATPEPPPPNPDPFPQPPLTPPSDPADSAPDPSETDPTTVPGSIDFLYTGDDPVQEEVDPGTIEPTRVAVLRGRVLGPDGADGDSAPDPLPGARVTILDHPELGYTATRADGRYDLAVNGGGSLVLEVRQLGFASVQRNAEVPWQDYVDVEDIVLTPYDDKVTAITENAPGLQVATSDQTPDDGDGARKATLMFEPGTDAVMEFPGGETRPLGNLEVRATEYTVGANGDQAMPGDLPPTSAYTYAVEFSVDQAVEANATDVQFTKPVITYVDNFLGFPAGSAVPAAYYDEKQASWVPSENGLVLVIDADGAINADTDAAPESAAELDALGIDQAEREQLAAQYPDGGSLWRVPVRHFTPWDYNWPYGCEDICDPPDQDPPPPPPCPECEGGGSVIGLFNQTLGESLPLTGSPFTLEYSSARVPGYRDAYQLKIPLVGAGVPSGLQRVDLSVTVAGKAFTRSFSPQSNQSFTFEWDGLDAYGRRVQGAQTASVSIGYVYRAVYLEPARFQASFAQYGGAPVTGDRTRNQLTVSQQWERPIGVLGAGSDALGGWTIDVHHSYDPGARTLHLGNGRRLTSEAIRSEIHTVAGLSFGLGDHTPAMNTPIGLMRGIAVGADGSLYIAETERDRVQRVTPDGQIDVVAGGGDPDDGVGDGLQATEAALVAPSAVAVDAEGVLYISDSGNARVRRVGADGTIQTVAGGGDPDVLGDDGPATQASLSNPRGIALAADGTLYVADAGDERVRRITPDGRITTAAGGGSGGLGDGGRAVDASLDLPLDVALDAAGTLYIADAGQRRVRAVPAEGTIATVAGNGGAGSSGDGGPATTAAIGQPHGLDVGADGSLYIADRAHHRVRRVDADGTISGFAGSGVNGDAFDFGENGDGGAPLGARLSFPQDVAVAPDGAVYIADAGQGRVRRAAVALPGFSDAQFALPSEDGSEVYLFDSVGRHLRTVDGLTGSTLLRFAYDAAGRLVTITDTDGNVTRVERAADGSATAIVAPGGQRTALTVGAEGLGLVRNPAGEATQLAYASGGLLTTLTEPGGGVHHYDYAAATGRLVRDQSPDGEAKTLTRREVANGREIEVKTALGRTSLLRYEQLPGGLQRRTLRSPSGATRTIDFGEDGRHTVTDPDGTVTTTTLGPDPRWGMRAPMVASETIATPGGRRRVMTGTRSADLRSSSDLLSVRALSDEQRYNGRPFRSDTEAQGDGAPTGWTVTDTSAENRQSVVRLDARGRQISFRGAGVTAPFRLHYDAKGRIDHADHGDRSIDLTYDAAHRITAETDATGARTGYGYDAADRIVRRTLPGDRDYGYEYDDDGNLTAIVAPSGDRHEMTRTLGDKEDTYDPPGSGAAYDTNYNADGVQTSLKLPSGATMRSTYDSAGRLSTEAGPEVTDALAYPAAGDRDRPVSLTRTVAGRPAGEAQRLALTFDGPLVSATRSTGLAAGNVSYAYDDDFRPVDERIESGGEAVATALSYDGDDFLDGSGPFTLLRAGPEGAISQISDTAATPAGALTLTNTYDGQGRLASKTVRVAGAQRYRLALGHDASGRIDERTETVGAAAAARTTYGYDGAGQLRRAARGGAAVETYAYDANGNRTLPAAAYDDQDRQTSLGGTPLAFDADGFLTGRGTASFNYAVNGDLLSATVGGATVRYGYDAIGRRVWRQDAAGTHRYFYAVGPDDEQFQVSAVRDPSGALTKLYYDDTGALYAMQRGSERFYVASDQLGSPRLVIAPSGAVVRAIAYDSFGKVVSDSDPSVDLPIGFAGGLGDPATGLVRFGWRDYDPATGRWTAKDPIRFEGSPDNLYAYIGSEPVGSRDPSGLQMNAGLKKMQKLQSKPKAVKEYKKLSKEVAGEKSEESAENFSDKVKNLWKKCTKALGGDDSPSPDQSPDDRPPPSNPPLQEFTNS